MGLSCRAWTGSQISLLFGLEGLVQDCFELSFGFKGLGLKSCLQRDCLRASPSSLVPPRAADGQRGASRHPSPHRGAPAIGLHLYRLL